MSSSISVACAVDATPRSNDWGTKGDTPTTAMVTVNDVPVATKYGAILSTVRTADGQLYSFGRTAGGDLVIDHVIAAGSQPATTLLTGSIADIYTLLSNGSPVPAPLLEWRGSSTPTTAPRPETGPSGAQFQRDTCPANTPDQNWFVANYCPNNGHVTCVVCSYPVNADNYFSVYQSGSTYYLWGYSDGSNSGSSTLYDYVWETDGEGDYYWYNDWSYGMEPGDLVEEYWYYSTSEWRSAIVDNLYADGVGALAMRP